MDDDAPLGVTVSKGGRRVTLAWADGRSTAAPAPWLFDNADGACDPVSGHRLAGGLALDPALAVDEARLDDGALLVRFAPGGETRRVPLCVLAPSGERPAEPAAPWLTPSGLPDAPLAFAAYLADDAVLAEALGRIARHGLVFLAGAGTQPGAVEQAVARFGLIRETNYGRLFDVREEAEPSHLAYTSVGLELHTDNPYRDPPPGLQVLHAIETAAEGGESQFVDGLAHALALREAAPERFRRLASTPAPFAYRSPDGARYEARAPVIETDLDGAVVGLRVNHRALRALPLDGDEAEAWYDAYLDFYRRLHAPVARLERRLDPGEMVIFDNRRLLHGRSAYAGARWLQGCYAERDGLMATLARLSGRAA